MEFATDGEAEANGKHTSAVGRDSDSNDGDEDRESEEGDDDGADGDIDGKHCNGEDDEAAVESVSRDIISITDSLARLPSMKAGLEHDRFLVIWNISKKNNVKALIHIALGFGFVPIIVGLVELEKTLHFDNKLDRSKYIHFVSAAHLLNFLESKNILLVAIEITETSESIYNNSLFRRDRIAFMLGNEGSGLNSTQRKYAQGYLYIPQYGNGTASLNVTVAGSIVLNCYYHWTLQVTDRMGDI